MSIYLPLGSRELTWNLVKWKKGQIKNGLIMQKNKVTNRKVTDPDRKWTT